MPYQFQYYPTEFQCNLKKERCVGHTKTGNRCKRNVCIGLDYCFSHLQIDKHLKIKASTIPNAGKGLFALNKQLPENAIVFRKGNLIIDYNGDNINSNQLHNRYGDDTAPYAVQVNNNQFIDASCRRCIGSLANTNRNTNARLSLYRGKVNIKATKNIKNGDEIFVDYGPIYEIENNYRTIYKSN